MITPERAKQIELATNGAVTRHELRPDIFDPPAVVFPTVEEAIAESARRIAPMIESEEGAA